MNVIEWAVSSVLGSTLHNSHSTGAIDVIAIRRADGSLCCSPFHVKLGKASKKGERRLVTLRVNSEDVSLSMKLGPAGEAFFVEKARDYIYSQQKMDSSSSSLGNSGSSLPHFQPLSIESDR